MALSSNVRTALRNGSRLPQNQAEVTWLAGRRRREAGHSERTVEQVAHDQHFAAQRRGNATTATGNANLLPVGSANLVRAGDVVHPDRLARMLQPPSPPPHHLEEPPHSPSTGSRDSDEDETSQDGLEIQGAGEHERPAFLIQHLRVQQLQHGNSMVMPPLRTAPLKKAPPQLIQPQAQAVQPGPLATFSTLPQPAMPRSAVTLDPMKRARPGMMPAAQSQIGGTRRPPQPIPRSGQSVIARPRYSGLVEYEAPNYDHRAVSTTPVVASRQAISSIEPPQYTAYNHARVMSPQPTRSETPHVLMNNFSSDHLPLGHAPTRVRASVQGRSRYMPPPLPAGLPGNRQQQVAPISAVAHRRPEVEHLPREDGRHATSREASMVVSTPRPGTALYTLIEDLQPGGLLSRAPTVLGGVMPTLRFDAVEPEQVDSPQKEHYVDETKTSNVERSELASYSSAEMDYSDKFWLVALDLYRASTIPSSLTQQEEYMVAAKCHTLVRACADRAALLGSDWFKAEQSAALLHFIDDQKLEAAKAAFHQTVRRMYTATRFPGRATPPLTADIRCPPFLDLGAAEDRFRGLGVRFEGPSTRLVNFLRDTEDPESDDDGLKRVEVKSNKRKLEAQRPAEPDVGHADETHVVQDDLQRPRTSVIEAPAHKKQKTSRAFEGAGENTKAQPGNHTIATSHGDAVQFDNDQNAAATYVDDNVDPSAGTSNGAAAASKKPTSEEVVAEKPKDKSKSKALTSAERAALVLEQNREFLMKVKIWLCQLATGRTQTWKDVLSPIIAYYETEAKARGPGLTVYGTKEKLDILTARVRFRGRNLPTLSEVLAIAPYWTDRWASDDLLKHYLENIQAEGLPADVHLITSPAILHGFLDPQISDKRVADLLKRHLKYNDDARDNGEDGYHPVQETPAGCRRVVTLYNPSAHWMNVVFRVNDDKTVGNIDIYNSMSRDSLRNPKSFVRRSRVELPLLAALISQQPSLGWQNVVWSAPSEVQCAQQMNSDDCGFFALESLRRLLQDEPQVQPQTSAARHELGHQLRYGAISSLYRLLCSDEPPALATAGPATVPDDADDGDRCSRCKLLRMQCTHGRPELGEDRPEMGPDPMSCSIQLDEMVPMPMTIRLVITDYILQSGGHSDAGAITTHVRDALPDLVSDMDDNGSSYVQRILDFSPESFVMRLDDAGVIVYCVQLGLGRSVDSTTVRALLTQGSAVATVPDDIEHSFEIIVPVMRKSGAHKANVTPQEMHDRATALMKAHYARFQGHSVEPTLGSTTAQLLTALSNGEKCWFPHLNEPGTSRKMFLSDPRSADEQRTVDRLVAASKWAKDNDQVVSVKFLMVAWDGTTTNNQSWSFLAETFPDLDLHLTAVVPIERVPCPQYGRPDPANDAVWLHYRIPYLAKLYDTVYEDGDALHLCSRRDLESAYFSTSEYVPDCDDCTLGGLLDPVMASCLELDEEEPISPEAICDFYAHAQFLIVLTLVDHWKLDKSILRQYKPDKAAPSNDLAYPLVIQGRRRNLFSLPTLSDRVCEACGKQADDYIRGNFHKVSLLCLDCSSSELVSAVSDPQKLTHGCGTVDNGKEDIVMFDDAVVSDNADGQSSAGSPIITPALLDEGEATESRPPPSQRVTRARAANAANDVRPAGPTSQVSSDDSDISEYDLDADLDAHPKKMTEYQKYKAIQAAAIESVTRESTRGRVNSELSAPPNDTSGRTKFVGRTPPSAISAGELDLKTFKTMLTCQDCGEKIESSYMPQHAFSHGRRLPPGPREGSKVKTCPKCSFSCGSHNELEKHIAAMHPSYTPQWRFPCSFPGCTRGFDTEQGRGNHMTRSHKPKRKCPYCGKAFPSSLEVLRAGVRRSAYARHLRDAHDADYEE
ncbi:hypothetical protein LTS10_007959 [Elasticomyces elasticus]|nr:hypothetical protein LTS10_007959 [Elasticomyces elasticus]